MDAFIFLDIDGVLNREPDAVASPPTVSELWTSQDIDLSAVLLLNALVEVTRARIVVSSSWRLHHSLPELIALLGERGLTGRIVGATPRMSGESRGVEIRTWLMANASPSSAFVVLDDQAPSADLDAHWVRTDPSLGLSENDVHAATQILSSPGVLAVD